MFICPVVNRKYTFWVNLVQKNQKCLFLKHGVCVTFAKETDCEKVELTKKVLKNVYYLSVIL